MKRFVAAVALTGAAAAAQAAAINHADVNGFRTFQDSVTGLIWADLDNWLLPFSPQAQSLPARYITLDQYLAGLQAAGFTWASPAEVNALLANVPLGTNANAHAAYAAMSTDWGSVVEHLDGYSTLGTLVGNAETVQEHHLNFSSSISWVTNNPFTVPLSLAAAQIGLWAYAAAPVSNVPEPGTLTLVGLGLAAVALRRRAPR